MEDTIKVTVYLSTYNQEEYIAEALDSILMQKTDFKYELLVADDCSTDQTQEIVLQYQKKYPDIISTYFTPVNVGGCKKLVDCIEKGLFQGEYLAYLEGDDYWINEKRLQILVDFLESYPEYSRVSHKRMVIDENGNKLGFDISEDVLNKPFYIKDFLDGKSYSDFGSVFRNYFKEAGDKYFSLLLASRNVCDFQDMFITQDFGPVYVLDECLGVYRSRSVVGASNYNSITTQTFRCKENIRLAKTVEEFYQGKYDMTPMIRSNQKRMLEIAIRNRDVQMLSDVRTVADNVAIRKLIPEIVYLAWRGKRQVDIEFIKLHLEPNEKKGFEIAIVVYGLKRIFFKLIGRKINERKRGEINAAAHD